MAFLFQCCAETTDEANQIQVPAEPVCLSEAVASAAAPPGKTRAEPDPVPAPAAETPAATSAPVGTAFQVELGYEPGKLGMELDLTDDKSGPMVSVILPDGIVKAWNDANPAQAIRVYDRISSINGESGAASDLYKKIGSSGPTLLLTIDRPELFDVELKKPGDIGLNLHYKKSSQGLVVKDIYPGLLEAWNAGNPTKRVVIGDRIVAFNGAAMKGAALVNKLKDENVLKMTIAHY